MKSWQPEPGEPLLLDWFAPLLAVARRAREDEVPWLITLDDFRLLGRFQRQGRPDIWTYALGASGGLLFCDGEGRTYKFIESTSGRSRGQFRECQLRPALWRSGLPNVADPVWYHRPPPAPRYDDPIDEIDHQPRQPVPRNRPRRRRHAPHLRLVVNNRNSA